MDRFLLRTNATAVPTMNVGLPKVAKSYEALFTPSAAASESNVVKQNSVIAGNPVGQNLVIKLAENFKADKVRYSIKDISGRMIHEGHFTSAINVSQLKSSVYFVKLNDGKNSESLKFIKKKQLLHKEQAVSRSI